MRRNVLMLYVISMLLGIITGLVAALFQLAIRGMDWGLDALYQVVRFHGWSVGLVSAVMSMLMVFLAWFSVQYIAPEAAGSGVQEIEGALLHVRPIHWRRVLPVKFFAGVLALCAKMIMGREGPTIQMGGNLGDMLGEFFQLPRRRRTVLIAAGAAAGLAAAFNAPLAGVLFVMEEMRNQFDYSFTHFKMVIICCVMASITVNLVIGSHPAIPMQVFEMPSLLSLSLFFLFGLLIGLVSYLFNVVLMGSLSWVDNLSQPQRLSCVLVIGACVGYLAYAYPLTVGGGYNIMAQELTGSASLSVLGLLIVVRFIMGMLCYSTGVPGGIFAPILALGTLLGLGAFRVLDWLIADFSIHPGMFAVAGMGGLFAGAVRSPITGVVLVVEMTQNYLLILPLMITCITATTVMQLLRNPPIYTQLLKRTLSNAR